MNTNTENRRGRSGSGSTQRKTSSGSSSKPTYRGNTGNRRSGGSSHGKSSNGRRGGGRKMPTFDPSQFINKNPVEVKVETYEPKNTFNTFGLDRRLVHTVNKMGITIPTPIQDQIIPEIMKGNDVIGLAETGTGKTAAFLLPLIQKTLKDNRRQTLIMAPTRELAIQIEEELRKLSQGLRIFSTVCVGGVNIRPQIKALKRSHHFVIGTPGRLLDLINRKYFKTSGIKTVILDEADRMLDMGFIHDIKKIMNSIPTHRETLFFSATTSKETDAIVHDFLNKPVTISVKKKDVTDSIEQDVIAHRHDDKFDTLMTLLSKPEFERILIFGAMKHSVEKLSRELSKSGLRAESIHGNKNHTQRQRALKSFKDGRSQVLVATDVAARGIHVDDVSHVINYDLPQTFEDYVHRIGRTGRGNKRGKALTFITHRKSEHRKSENRPDRRPSRRR